MIRAMFDNGVDVLGRLRSLVGELDVKALDPEAAAELVEFFVEVEHLAAAGRVLPTQAVARGDVWFREGFRSAAAWMADRSGVTTGSAIAAMKMAEELAALPLLAEAFRAGRLSEAQAREIVDVAAEVPEAQEELLEAAGKLPLAGLREQCRRVRATLVEDEAERHRRIHRGRYVRAWVDRDGAMRLSVRCAPDEGAAALAAIDARRDEIILEAWKGRFYENPEAHRADALIDLVCGAAAGGGEGSAPRATVHVVVDYEALVRGYPVGGERCEVPGLGPLPVALVRRMLDDCILKVLVTKGVEITAVAHGGRTVPAHLRTALAVRDPKCIVPHCQVRRGLQEDHREPWSATRDTSLENMARLCRWHHYQKTFLGYRYRGGPGTWQWIPPDEPVNWPGTPP